MLRPIPVFPFNVRTNAVGLRSESGRGQVTDHHWPGQDWNDRKKWSAADRVDLALALEGRRTVEDAAYLLGRGGTIEDVRQKVQELGLIAN